MRISFQIKQMNYFTVSDRKGLYHGFRCYAVAYPAKPPRLKKIAMILRSGDPNVYDGAIFSYQGDFLDYLGLENMGVYSGFGLPICFHVYTS